MAKICAFKIITWRLGIFKNCAFFFFFFGGGGGGGLNRAWEIIKKKDDSLTPPDYNVARASFSTIECIRCAFIVAFFLPMVWMRNLELGKLQLQVVSFCFFAFFTNKVLDVL